MQKRKFDELISYFNRKVADMDIDTNYKMELLGMVTALGYAHEKETEERKTGKWIDCDGSEHWKCDKCGCRAGYWFNEENSSSWELDMSEWLSDFCPNCGADMREGDTT